MMVGRTIRGYQLEELIGSGGYGAVYRAVQPSVEREVAIKIILPQFSSDTDFARRFEREARLVANLEHPAIVPLYDYWSDETGAYLVMRWLRGGSLKQALVDEGWDLNRTVQLIGQIAGGLALAHEKGIIHRDIKPANILLDQMGHAYLTDFGFAKDQAAAAELTSRGTLIGSPAYMSPEQIRGEPVGPSTDIYSLGVVLYEILVGQKPFGESSPSTVIFRHLNDPLPAARAARLDLPEEVDWIIQKATSKEADQRYSNVMSLADDLAQCVAVSDPPAWTAFSFPEDSGSRQITDFFLEQGDRRHVERPVFVARERELADLKGRMDAAIAGEGQVVFIAGEAGQGKTALLDEFSRRTLEEHPDLLSAAGNCNAFSGVGDPYLPFRDIFGMLTGDIESKWVAGSISRIQAANLLEFASAVISAVTDEGLHLIDVLVPGADLLKRATQRRTGENSTGRKLGEILERKSAGSADLEQRQIFEETSKVLQSLAVQRPLLLILDDLQWADEASVNLLFQLGRRLSGKRILIVGAYRPSEIGGVTATATASPIPAHRILEPAISEFKRIFGEIVIDLGQYPLAEGRAFVDALLDSEPNTLTENFRSKLFWKTRGHALFTSELLSDMKQRGDLLKNEGGHWTEGPSLEWDQLPARVEAVIERRIGRLEEQLRDVLNVASVEGEEFTAEVIARVTGIDHRQLIRWLSGELDRHHRLVIARGMKRLGNSRLSVYRFRHSLFQEYLYQNLDEVERAYLHEELGDELERLYADSTEDVAPQLARHFLEAGIHDKSVDYLLQAGDRAIRLSAHTEAIDHLQRGLELIPLLPQGTERDERELQLNIAIGVPLQVKNGPGASEVGQAYTRARELYQEVGQPSQLYPAMWGLWRFYRSRADFQTARELAHELLELTLEVGDPALILQGHHAEWTTFIYLGQPEEAMKHIEKGLALYSPQEHHSDSSLFSGHDLGVCAHTMAGYALWMLGYPDKALARAREALSLSQKFNHPSSLALSYEHLAGIHRFRREAQAVFDRAQDLIAIAEKMGSDYDGATGHVLQGWAMVELGKLDQGLHRIRQGLAIRRPAGAGKEDAHILAVLAEALGKAGQIEEGLLLLDELILTIEDSGQRFWEAEVHRLKGQLLQQSGRPPQEIAGHFKRSVIVAREQNARSLELRAVMNLVHLGKKWGRDEGWRDQLLQLVEWFDEGIETPDLVEAKALLTKGRKVTATRDE